MMVRTCRPATCCRTSNSFSIIASTKFISYIFCCKVMFFNMKSGCSWCVKIISIRRIISIKTNRNYRSSLINRKFFSFITVRIPALLQSQQKILTFTVYQKPSTMRSNQRLPMELPPYGHPLRILFLLF